jgi:protocatechuate 4,5-dioxygenase beta chain
VANLFAGVGTSHVPGIGAAVDHDKTQLPYWKPLFDGYGPAREWMEREKPDVVIIVYNDHASAFSLELIPTFAMGVAAEFQPADEGYGPRQVPVVEGHPELAWHICESLIMDEFDMTIANKMPVDHGLTCAAVNYVWSTRGLAVQSYSPSCECYPVSAASRQPMFCSGQGHPCCGGLF